MSLKTLKALRKRLKLTQKQLAKVLGVSKQTIANWESGRIEVPKTSEIALKSLRPKEKK